MSSTAYLSSEIIQARLPSSSGITPFIINFLATHDDGAVNVYTWTPTTYFPSYASLRITNVTVADQSTGLGAHTSLIAAGPSGANFTLTADANGNVYDSKSIPVPMWLPTTRQTTITTRVFTAGAGANQVLIGISLFGELWQGDHLPTATRVTLDGIRSLKRVS